MEFTSPASDYRSIVSHREWSSRYITFYQTTWHLMMTPEWWAANMPPDRQQSLRAVYLDREKPGETHDRPMWAAWDDVDADWHGYRLDNQPMGMAKVLGGYFYNEHHCPCHRIQAVLGYEKMLEFPCEGDRFPIQKIYAPSHPDLILYSETMTEAELEKLLAMDATL